MPLAHRRNNIQTQYCIQILKREGVIDMLTKEKRSMIEAMINEKGSTINEDGKFEECTLYTKDIKRLLELGANLMYHGTSRRFNMTNW